MKLFPRNHGTGPGVGGAARPTQENSPIGREATEALEIELKKAVEGEVRFDTTTRALYATDGSNYRRVPIGVVIPRTTEDVVRTVVLCRKYGAPLFSRGGGTALAGQTCNTAVCIDFSKYLNRILEIDPVARTARVQPGVILDHLRAAAQQQGLTFGPDPATHSQCTLGGMLGNNSCGIHSVMAGRTADNVHELEILTYDGLRLRVGPTSEKELAKIIAEGGRRGQIYAGLKQIRDTRAAEIRRRYPRIPRRVSGYNLDELLPENGFHVARALVGSESTCVTILEATLRLVPNPPKRILLVLGYPDVFSAGDHIPQIMKFAPIGLEGIDNMLVRQMKKTGMHPKKISLLPDGGGWLLVEFGGANPEEARSKAEAVMAALQREKPAPAMKLFDDREQAEKVWEIRESGLGATAHVPGEPITWPGWEDAAVDPRHVGDYLREFRSLLDEFQYNASLYGHFGQGCIHCRINFDLFTREGIDTYLRFVDRASDLVMKYNGSFSGEHGDGQSRGALLGKMYGQDLLDSFRRFKTLWDPDWKMNPGKVIDPRRPDEDLRLGEDYRPLQPKTWYRFPEDRGSMSRATLRCVGVGKCRRTENAFMCPSFLATREEQHTTRGRAHILFEMLRGDFIKDGFLSEEVLETLDLCLGCKGCKKECPVDVDIETYKSEFLAHYYKDRARPRHHFFLGMLDIFGAAGATMPQVANFLSSAPLLHFFSKAVAGVHPERPLPRFAAETFSAWFDRRPPAEGGQPVLLYPDSFNDFFNPQALQAIVRLFERWGFRVIVPPKHPAIRPLLHFGMLDQGLRELQQVVAALAPFLRQGIPVIVAEPSTASVFKEDLPALLPEDSRAQQLAARVRLFSEFVGDGELRLPEMRGKALFHAHCHEKAVFDTGAAKRVLDRMGLVFVEPEHGCCGMAGSFGFEKAHYEISRRIGEAKLLPAVRATGLDTWIVADGFSCRTQIKDGTGRRPLHMAELIQEGFRLYEKGATAMEVTQSKTGESPVVVITGGSAGLGRATAQAYARQGARLCLVARGEERLEEARREAIHLGGQAMVVAGDVADPEVLERAAEETERTFGPIDIWVNNAMATIFAEFTDILPEEFRRVTEVTYLGYVHGTQAALKRMEPRDRGVIVQVGSALGFRSIPLQSAYCGAKHAIYGFTESVRTELLHKNSKVRITVVHMPALNTPQFTWNRSRMPKKPQPVPPVFQPEVGAEAVLYAARTGKKQVYVGFSTLKAIYGDKLAAALLDRYAADIAYEGQMTDEPSEQDRPDNLFDPDPGLYSAHGRFDAMAKSRSLQFDLSRRGRTIGLAALAVGVGLGAGLLLMRTKARIHPPKLREETA